MDTRHYDVMYENESTHWWYRVRREIIFSLLSSIAKKRGEPLRILEVGCGTGTLLKEIDCFGSVRGIDISPYAIAYCEERGLTNVTVGDAAQIPFPDESFDVVIALDVLEHLKDDTIGCREIIRVLSPEGTAIIAVPAFMFLWGVTDVVSHHFRRYTRRQIVSCILKAGFIIDRATYFNIFLFLPIAMVRLGVRVLSITMRSENTITGRCTNAILYRVFRSESLLLRYFNFPFGVSILITANK
ncbi:MAG: class I SAM-dependent methyltransferase [Minisyncoccia bacterium]